MSSKEQEKFVFNWKIDNFFSCYQKNGTQLSSPIFTAENFGGSKWSIWIYPKGYTKESEDYVSCYLIKKADDFYGEISIIDYELKMIYGNGQETKSFVHKNCSFKTKDGNGCERFIRIDLLTQEMAKWKETSVTICCLMTTTQKKKNLIECCAQTKIGVFRQSFPWVVKLLDASQFYKKQFTFPDESQFEITLSLSSDLCKIQIRRKSDNSTITRLVTGNISICDANKKTEIGKWDSHLFEPEVKNDVWEFPTLVTKRQLKDDKRNLFKDKFCWIYCYLRRTTAALWGIDDGLGNTPQDDEDGKIRLFCTFLASNGIESEGILSDSRLGVDTSLQKDLRDLLSNKKLSDLKLQVEDEIIMAHRCLLSSRAPEFFAVLVQNTNIHTGTVRIDDVKKKDMKLFLEFIYTGSVDGMNYDKTSKLLAIAHKYQVRSLMERCVSFLIRSLDVNNACEVLMNADSIKHKLLKSSAMNYIATHAKDVLKTSGWSKLIKNNEAMLKEVFSNVANNFEISPKKSLDSFKETSL